jgi:FAD-dependent oxidoreductase domain-containing protein 1
LNGFKRKAISLGVQYINGEVCNFDYKRQQIGDSGPNSVIIRTLDGTQTSLELEHCVIATGYESGHVSALAGIGTGKGLLSHPIPVEPK